MFGTSETFICSECEKECTVKLGCVDVYQDTNGIFYCPGDKCSCGHTLNSERLPNSKKIGIDCH